MSLLLQKLSFVSSYVVESALLRLSNQQWKLVGYESQKLSDAEKHYAKIENEALILSWVSERFSPYVIGKTIDNETNHKPLVQL